MAKRTITISNVEFELQRLPISDSQIERNFRWAKGRSIYDAYEKPSALKVQAYEYWADFAREINADRIAVSSANSFRFSVIIENEFFFLWITAMHNRCFLKENTGLQWIIRNGEKEAIPFHVWNEVEK